MTTLPPYTPNATCPKCGGGEVTSKWWKDRRAEIERTGPYLPNPFPDRGLDAGEHVRRECTTCGYAWPEAPMDAEIKS